MIASDGNFDSAVEAIEGTLSNWNRIDSIWVRVQSSSYYWSFPIGDRALYYPAVTLTSISPTSGNRLQTLYDTLNGSNFIAGVTTVNFGPNITIDSVVVLSASQLRAYITISATAATGTRDVSVSNPSPGGGTATLSNAFTVNNPAPIVTSISPTSGNRLQTLYDTLNGSNFIAGVTTVNFGPNITIDSVVVLSASQLRAYITISATAATGTRDVSVSNPSPGGGTATLSNAFTVNNPAPIVTSISPTSGNRLQTLYDTLNGSNFISGVTVVNYGPGINVISTTVSSPTRIVANISISASAATGARRVYVTNSPPGGGTDSSRTFTVNNPAPSLIAISPDSGIRGQSLIVTFTGTGYIDGVSSVNVGPGITVDSLTVLDPTRIRAYISISFGATPGNRNFSVTNTPPGGGTSENRVFRVNNPGPTLTGITPAMGNRLDTLAVTFIGTNFFSGITSVNVGQGIIVRSTIVVSPETLTANITITDTAATGPRNFSVTNASPGGGTSGSQTFTINNPVPVLDSINPTDASRGQTLNLTLRGRKFIRGASFVNITPTGIAIDSTSVNSGTQMTARITVTSSATVGTYSVSVINQPPGGGASGSVTFNVINNAPTAPRLMAPAHGDTLQLMDPAVPVSFTWRRSLDPDPLDTLSYTLTLWGANLDTLFSGLTDTSVSLDIMERLQVATDYWWTIRVTDHIVTVTSPDTFLFRTSNTITAADLLPEIPKEYRVFQNYPNPFNTSTTIRYELPKESRVLLKVFNILGQEVATLVDEVKRPGRYSVQWNAGNVASGMYLYRLRAGEFVKTKKLVLLK